MSRSVKTWGELLSIRAGWNFIGHGAELEQFRLNCVYEIPESLLFLVHGVPGVGKTAMVQQMRHIAGEYGMMSAGVNRRIGQGYSPQVIINTLRELSQQIGQSGAYLSTVEEQYRTYAEALETIASDETAPAPIFDAFAGLYDDDVWYTRAWQAYLEGRFSRNVVTLLRNPVRELTGAFVHDLNAWSMVRRVVLCFDDWQELSPTLEAWLIDLLLAGALRTQIWVILASSAPLSKEWQSLQPLSRRFDLQPWSARETGEFLRLRAEELPRRIEDVTTFAKGLPLWAELLSSATSGTAGDLALTSLDRYLKWLDDTQRRAVLLCSAARVLDEGIISVILEDGSASQTWLWLQGSPLTIPMGEGMIYQPSLRAQFVDTAWREYPERYRTIHYRLWQHYGTQRNGTFEALYHGFSALVPDAIALAVSEFCILLNGNLHQVDAMLDACLGATAEMGSENVATAWAALLHEGWQLIQQHAWKDSLAWVEKLLHRDDLSSEMAEDLRALHSRISARIPAPVLVEEPLAVEKTGDAMPAPESEAPSAEPFVEEPTTPVSAAESVEVPPLADVGEPEASLPETAPLDSMPVQSEPDPPADDLAYERGLRLLQEEDRDAALAAFDEAIAINAGHAAAHFQRGELLAQAERLDDAVMAYSQVLALEPLFPEASRQRGMAFLKLRSYVAVVEDLTSALEQNPHDIGAYFHRANALYGLERFADAVKDYDQVLQRNPAYVDAIINRGLARKRNGAYAAAIEDFTSALHMRPASVRVLLYRGDTFARMQAYTSALADYDAAAVLNPENALVHNNRGLVYVKMERYDDALAAYRTAIALDEDFATAWYNAACAAALSADEETAVTMLTRAISLRPDYRAMAAKDTDFDAVRDSEALQLLIEA